ncbi:MAG: hypothetical protein FJ095_20730, partial [Deltaproteobacteria bacterium]|nr:hypothetical protein [Deltaproteobacteria bacterium]
LDLLSVEASFAFSALAGGVAIEVTGRLGSAAAVGIALGSLGWLGVSLGARSIARKRARGLATASAE